MSLIVSIHWNCIWSTPKSGFRVKLPKESNICGIYKILFWKDFSFFREVESGPSHLHSVSPDVIILHYYGQIRSVAQSCLTLRPHESQHTRPPCPSPTPRVHWDSCPSSQWCHPVISSSVVPFSSCPQSLPASESFPMSQLITMVHLSKLGNKHCYIIMNLTIDN